MPISCSAWARPPPEAPPSCAPRSFGPRSSPTPPNRDDTAHVQQRILASQLELVELSRQLGRFAELALTGAGASTWPPDGERTSIRCSSVGSAGRIVSRAGTRAPASPAPPSRRPPGPPLEAGDVERARRHAERARERLGFSRAARQAQDELAEALSESHER